MAAEAGITIDPVFGERGVQVALAVLTAAVGPVADSARVGAALEEASRKAALRAAIEQERPGPIAATRRAYKACGKDPSRYRPASEALLRRVVRGEAVPTISPLVDVCNLVSLTTGFACGLYDADMLDGAIRLRLGAKGDIYSAIGRGAFNVENLPVLADARGVFGSPTADSERTAVAAHTARVLFVAYGFDMDPAPAAAEARVALGTHFTGAGILTSAMVTRPAAP